MHLRRKPSEVIKPCHQHEATNIKSQKNYSNPQQNKGKSRRNNIKLAVIIHKNTAFILLILPRVSPFLYNFQHFFSGIFYIPLRKSFKNGRRRSHQQLFEFLLNKKWRDVMAVRRSYFSWTRNKGPVTYTNALVLSPLLLFSLSSSLSLSREREKKKRGRERVSE